MVIPIKRAVCRGGGATAFAATVVLLFTEKQRTLTKIGYSYVTNQQPTQPTQPQESEMMWIIIVAIWVVCGALSFGLMLHYYQTRFKCFGWPNRRLHVLAAFLAGVSGPAGLLQRVLVGWDDVDNTPWRLKYRLVTADESWGEYHRRWPHRTIEQWLQN